MYIRYLGLLLFGLSTSLLHAQEVPLDNLDTELREAEEYLLWLRALRQYPLALHAIRQEELERLPGMDPDLAARVLSYRTKHGPFGRLDDLLAVEGMTPERIEAIRPYVAVQPPRISWYVEARHRWRYTLEQKRGWKDATSGYARVPVAFLQQITFQRGNRIRLHLTAEQDAGEPFRWQPSRGYVGPDFLALSLRLQDMGPVRTLILGAYRLALGRGLVIWQGFQQGKGRDVMAGALQWGDGLRMHRSSSEGAYMQGVATEVHLTRFFRLLLALSWRARDARVEEGGIRSLLSNGYHRSYREQAQRGAVRERWAGWGIRYQRGAVEAGFIAYRVHFSHPLQPDETPYTRFYLRGKIVTAGSAFARVHMHHLMLSGEVAAVNRLPAAFSGTLSYRVSRRVRGVWSVRWLPRTFQGLYGMTFQEAGTYPANEQGGYLGLQLIPARGWRIQGFVDMYTFSWVRRGRSVHGGQEMLVEVRYRRGARWELYGLFHQEGQEKLQVVDSVALRIPREVYRRRVRVHARVRPCTCLYMDVRGEVLRVTDTARLWGGLVYSEAGGTLWKQVLRGGVRLTLFNTPEPLYVYERDLPYAFRTAVLRGKGYRLYAYLQYTWKQLTLSLKVEQTRYLDRNTIGSGWEAIDGNRVRMMGFQISWSRSSSSSISP